MLSPVVQALRTLCHHQKLCDISLLCQGELVSVHKVVIMSHSRLLCTHILACVDAEVINLDNLQITATSLRKIISFIYKGFVEEVWNMSMIQELYQAADTLQMDHVKYRLKEIALENYLDVNLLVDATEMYQHGGGEIKLIMNEIFHSKEVPFCKAAESQTDEELLHCVMPQHSHNAVATDNELPESENEDTMQSKEYPVQDSDEGDHDRNNTEEETNASVKLETESVGLDASEISKPLKQKLKLTIFSDNAENKSNLHLNLPQPERDTSCLARKRESRGNTGSNKTGSDDADDIHVIKIRQKRKRRNSVISDKNVKSNEENLENQTDDKQGEVNNGKFIGIEKQNRSANRSTKDNVKTIKSDNDEIDYNLPPPVSPSQEQNEDDDMDVIFPDSRNISSYCPFTKYKNSDGVFQCPDCEFNTERYHQFSRHFKAHRTKPFDCTLCEKKFTCTKHLKSHLRTHSSK